MTTLIVLIACPLPGSPRAVVAPVPWRECVAKVVGKGLLLRGLKLKRDDAGSLEVSAIVPGGREKGYVVAVTFDAAGKAVWDPDVMARLPEPTLVDHVREWRFARWIDAALRLYAEEGEGLELGVRQDNSEPLGDGTVFAIFSGSRSYTNFYTLTAEDKVAEYVRLRSCL